MSEHQSDEQLAKRISGSVQDQQEENYKSSGPALIEKFVIRLPKGLRNKIKHLSEQNRRSMNSEIIMVLEQHIQSHLPASSKEIVKELTAGIEDSIRSENDFSERDRPSDTELARRLEQLPEEKKQALLELLG